MRILQREIRGGNRHFAQIDATTRIAAKVFVVIRKNTLHYLALGGGTSGRNGKHARVIHKVKGAA